MKTILLGAIVLWEIFKHGVLSLLDPAAREDDENHHDHDSKP